MFEPLGLSADAVAAYRVLLANPDMSPDQLAGHLSRYDSEVAEILEQLEEKGFVRRSHSDPTNLRTESPQVAFERLVGQHEIELHRKQEELSQARSGAAALVDEYHRTIQNARHGEFERLIGTDHIVSRLLELGQNVESSVDSIVTKAPLPHVLNQAKSDDALALARGVRLRTLYPAAARHDDGVVEYAEWFRERGGQIRTAIALPVRVLIYDEKIAVVTSDPQDFSRGAVVLNTPGAITALQALFDLLWESGADLPSPAASENTLRAEERELLQLLSRGLKDEAISRSLGISIRTVRRMINVLSNRVDATSRFELGARAVERGWL
ncbi:LuxR C-terminal-related transcriptional regulator [Georgenia sp. EYE_87]|uniref:helix-turn-helix transcriptional regulator n=1 Tax=Georgenia sp. EYE_87 TaxID=2853448 RepID=UPI002005FD25|nr:LuxR family transcriptional regulator [Georgenia sp. EYE_87]MCK6211279.1 LuxR C-terminal-related transcriptional regulator [Georgenia sp. EYE_87]